MSPKEDDDIDLNEGQLPPDAPTNAEISDFDGSSATIKWKAPENDGGAPIKEYIIEYRKHKTEEWSAKTEIKPTKFPNGKVEELTTNTKYEFRVVAVNRAGQSQPSNQTEPQLIKATKAPPKIDRKTLGELRTCKVNQQLVLEIPVEGAPEPELWWRCNDQDVQTSITDEGQVKVKSSSNVAKMMFIPAKRHHCGKYMLMAKNKWGEDSAEVQIEVKGKPSMPTGPLKVSEVTKKGCLLQWGPPADNGGHEITHYEVEKMDVNSGQWLPIKNVKSFSLDVTNLVEGKSYKFLVRAVNQDGDSPDLETEEATMAKNPFDPPGPPSKPEVADWGEDFAELKWKAPEVAEGCEITEYRIEVRNRDKRAWNVAGMSKDTNFRVAQHMSEGNEYEFRVLAINKGGESEYSPSSASVLAKTRFIKPKINRDLLDKERTAYAGQQLKIILEIQAAPTPSVNWSFPDGREAKDDSRCSTDIDEFGTSVLRINDITRNDAGNFRVVVKNSQGYDEVEVRVDVLGTPVKPMGPLEVSGVHPNGCKLCWMKPNDDGGSPITGYVIEKKELDRDVWVACGKVTGKAITAMKFLEFDVNDLLPYFVYMFRVAAVNAQGEGDFLQSVMPTVAKHAVDPPIQPDTPRIVDFDKTWVKLEWWAPSNSDIKHYIVEKRETFMVPKDVEGEAPPTEEGVEPEADEEAKAQEQQSAAVKAALGGGVVTAEPAQPVFTGEFIEYASKWMVALVTDDATPEVTIKDLGENNKYQFRVKAVNKAGPSEPSMETDEIVCKIQKQRPVVNRDSIKPVSVSAGQTIVLSAKCIGEPIPAKAFFYGKIEIKACPSVDVNEKEHSLKVTMLGARRDDTGVYTFRCENEHGRDQADVEVLVKDIPSKPRGPLKIDDIFGEGCTVEWGPPEDDGGTPITHYVVEKSGGSSTTWSPCGRANGDCFKCRVVGLTPDKEYRIQVSAVNAEGTSEPLGGVDTFITENPFGTPGAPGRPLNVGGDYDHFDLKWDAPKNDGGSKIIGYQIEARPWKDNVYFLAGEQRHNLEFGEAGGVEVGQAYAVRIRAVNAAGPGPWSLDSDQMVARYKALKPKIVFNKTEKEFTFKVGDTMSFAVDVIGEPACENITWALGDKELVEGQGNGVVIDNSKPYKSKLTLEGLTRKDGGVLSVTASNTSGSAKASVKIIVVGKPSMPEDRLIVSNIHRGGCRLTWKESKDNGGLPIEYIVEKYVVAGDVWTNYAQLSGTSIEVNDLETGREYAFAVKAVNAEGESDALPTAKTMVAKDAFTAPLPPSAPDVTDWSERHISIAWKVPIDDGGAPITGYHVEAKARGDEEWQLWETVDTNTPSATMQKLQAGREYQFRVIAINKAGRSESSHPSRYKEARAQNLPPYIDAKKMHDITAICGDRIKFDLPIFGEPLPEVVWTRTGCGPDGETEVIESTPDRNIVITNNESHTKLVINSVTKGLSGKYAIRVCNASGTDEARAEVKVLDRPDAPQSLQANVDGTKCNLLWKKSKDDGGSAIEHYQIERFDNEKGQWTACGKTPATENTFSARGLLPGREYKFRVSAVNEHGDSDPAETKDSVIASADPDVMDSAVRNMY